MERLQWRKTHTRTQVHTRARAHTQAHVHTCMHMHTHTCTPTTTNPRGWGLVAAADREKTECRGAARRGKMTQDGRRCRTVTVPHEARGSGLPLRGGTMPPWRSARLLWGLEGALGSPAPRCRDHPQGEPCPQPSRPFVHPSRHGRGSESMAQPPHLRVPHRRPQTPLNCTRVPAPRPHQRHRTPGAKGSLWETLAEDAHWHKDATGTTAPSLQESHKTQVDPAKEDSQEGASESPQALEGPSSGDSSLRS